MEDLIKNLGINWQSLIFQIINFLILVYILKRFAYTPIIKVLEARKKKIEDSMKSAEKIEKDRITMKEEYEALLLAGRKEAQAIREQSFSDAEKIKADKVEETKQEITSLLDKAKKQIREEKDRALDDVRSEAGSLVMLATQKVLQRSVQDAHDRKIVEESLKEVLTAKH